MTLYNEKKQSVLYLIRNFKLIPFIISLERNQNQNIQTKKIKIYTKKKTSPKKFIKGNEKHKNIKPRKQMSEFYIWRVVSIHI